MVVQRSIITLAVITMPFFASDISAASHSNNLDAVQPSVVSDQAPSKNDKFKALTHSVIGALRNLNAATDPKKSDTSTKGVIAADRLRSAIGALVRHADDNGKSTSYITKLIDEAVTNSSTNIPAALLGADGKLDTALLVQSVVSRSLAPAAADADTNYLAALEQEVDSSAAPVKIAAKSRHKPKMIVVAPGDSLGRIAWKFYGDSLTYWKIFEANRDRLKNPNKIRIGMKLRLP